MAVATATLTVNAYPNGVDNTQRRQQINGTCVLLVAGTYPTLGIPVSFSGMKSGETGGAFILDNSTAAPISGSVAFFSMIGPSSANTNQTYIYDYTHKTLRIFVGGTEVVSPAVPATDTIGFTAEFAKGI